MLYELVFADYELEWLVTLEHEQDYNDKEIQCMVHKALIESAKKEWEKGKDVWADEQKKGYEDLDVGFLLPDNVVDYLKEEYGFKIPKIKKNTFNSGKKIGELL